MITKQPNGLYARISTIVDAPTDYNMTEEFLQKYLQQTNQLNYTGQTAKEWFNRYGISFERAKEMILPNNMTEREIHDWVDIVSQEPKGKNITLDDEILR